MLDINYCTECLETLENYGIGATVVYETVCEYFIYSEGCPLELCEGKCKRCMNFRNVVNFLENKGYLVSVEKDLETILVKPKGLFVPDYNEFIFCKNKCCFKA